MPRLFPPFPYHEYAQGSCTKLVGIPDFFSSNHFHLLRRPTVFLWFFLEKIPTFECEFVEMEVRWRFIGINYFNWILVGNLKGKICATISQLGVIFIERDENDTIRTIGYLFLEKKNKKKNKKKTRKQEKKKKKESRNARRCWVKNEKEERMERSVIVCCSTFIDPWNEFKARVESRLIAAPIVFEAA